ncbi:MAG: magnesium and cobalt transport protein CorA [Candidatus Tectimicrobiota bacterium]
MEPKPVQLLSFRKPYEMLPPMSEHRMLTHAFAYQHGAFLRDITLDEVEAVLQQDDTFVWIGLQEPRAELLKKMQARFDLHELALEDAYLAHQRPKMEEYGQTLFVVLHTMEIVNGTLQNGELHLFVGARFLLSICHNTNLRLAEVRQSCAEISQHLQHGPGFLLYAIFNVIVDRYQPVVHYWSEAIEEMETRLFHQPLDRQGLEDLYRLRHRVQTLRAATLPLVDVCLLLMRTRHSDLFPQEMGVYFRDVHDHLSQIVRVTESWRETLLAAMQMHLSLVAVQQNDIAKRLAGWGAIILVPTIMFSMYGMNFQHMPELQWQYGYPCTLLTTVLLCSWIYRRFKKNDWL